MIKISNLFSKHWRNLHFFFIIILTVALIIGDKSIVPYINQVSFAVFYSPFDKLKQTFLTLKASSEENEKLKTALAETSVKISSYEETFKENKRLRSILGFETPTGYILLPAKVISISGEFIPTSVIINKGSEDSLIIDMPVINQQGLIGRISSVSQDYAIVQLLTDPANRVAARLTRSREMGIIKFSITGGMILDNLPIQGDVKVNDTVISSGLGGIYPAGLNVGIVSNVKIEEHETFCEIKIKSMANFYSIDELFIVKEISQ